jgi:Carboxypeptidase regulatory-like domain/TonB-dependent Receptor Plug Domain
VEKTRAVRLSKQILIAGIAGLALMASLAPLQAQVTAAISGKVVDPTGTGVSGARVTVKSLETGATRSVTTDDAGNYRALSLPLGAQEVRAEKASFKVGIRTGIDLTVGQDAVVNLSLEIGDVAQVVTVSGASPVVNTTTSTVSGLVGENQVKDLPLNGRSFDDLITLNPGTVNYELKSAATSTSNGNTFSVDGRRPMDNLVLLNGVEYTGSSQLAVTPGGVSGDLLGVEAVREFNVLTDTYSAEYGKRSGAQVIAVTQSGTNSVHGSLYEFLRNSALDAKNFFAQNTIPPFRQNQFGAALGAPLKKDKFFIFGNYEGFRQALTQSNVSVVPDALVQTGEFPNATTGKYATVANLNPAMLPYFSLWPSPNGPELMVANASGTLIPSGTAFSYNSPKQNIHEDFGTVRSDYILSHRDTLSAAYTIDTGNSLVPLADPLFASYTDLGMQVASLQLTHIISPNALTTFTGGFSRAEYNLDSSQLATFPAGLAFVSGAQLGGIVVNGGVTTTGLSGITSAGPNNAAGAWNRRNLFTLSDGTKVVKGRHQISFGYWAQRVQDNEDTASRQLGQATFTSLTTMLQGTTSSFQVVPSANELGFRSWFGALYVDDSIKVLSNLTVELGLRLESTTGWNEESGRGSNYIVASTNGPLQTAPIVGNSVFSKNNASHLLGPRASLAWDPFKNGKTAVRAGFGTYYSMIDALSFLLNAVPPYNGTITKTGSLLSFLPIIPNAPVPPSCGPGVPSPCTTYAPEGVQSNAQTPTVQEWRLTVEQQLGHDSVLRVSYVGSHGYYGLTSVDPNDIPAQVCATATCTAGGTTTGGTPATSTSTVVQGQQYIPVGTRPNPYLGAGFFWYTEGNSSYNALQIDATKRLSHGVTFRANYTFAKNLDMNSALTGAQGSNQSQMVLDRNDLPRDWGPSALDVKNQVSLSTTYDLPFGKGKRFGSGLSGAAQKFVGGWQVNQITTLLSGLPFTPVIGANRSGDGDTRNPDRPSLNPNFTGPVIIGSPNEWYNPNAFILPAVGTYGNVGRGAFTGPGLADLDLSVMKNTTITERMKLQFRAEFFNILNHPNFASPNETVFSGTSFNASAGLITTTATTSRQIQFALKLMF